MKAIRGPQPWTAVMPTGGVSPTEESLSSWFNAGVTCVGMGSKLITSSILENQDYTGLEAKVRDCLDLIKQIRN